MTQNLYLILAVFIRFSGVALILSGLYSYLLGLIIGAVSHGALPGLAMAALLSPVLGGVILWLIARPVSRLVTSGLE